MINDVNNSNLPKERCASDPSKIEELLCGECKLIPTKLPSQCSECQRSICQYCIFCHKHAPNFLSAEFSPVHAIVKVEYLSLKFWCKNNNEGCEIKIGFEDLGNHTQICEYEKKECEKCLKTFTMKHLNSHNCIKELNKDMEVMKHEVENHVKQNLKIYDLEKIFLMQEKILKNEIMLKNQKYSNLENKNKELEKK